MTFNWVKQKGEELWIFEVVVSTPLNEENICVSIPAINQIWDLKIHELVFHFVLETQWYFISYRAFIIGREPLGLLSHWPSISWAFLFCSEDQGVLYFVEKNMRPSIFVWAPNGFFSFRQPNRFQFKVEEWIFMIFRGFLYPQSCGYIWYNQNLPQRNNSFRS